MTQTPSIVSPRVRPGRHPDDRTIAALGIPALGALAADPLYSLVDTAFVGRLGVPQLGGLAVGVAAFTASFWIFSFLAYGVTPRVARSLGAGDPAEAGRIGAQALLLAITLGAAVTVVGVVFTGPIVRAFGAAGDVTAFAESYLRIRVLAAIPVLITQVGQGFLRGAQDTRTPTYIVVAGAVLNIVFGYVFIFRFGWGIQGAAWATVVCQLGAALAFIWVLRRRMTVARWAPDIAMMRSLLRLGGELGVRTGSLLAGLTIATSLAARIGTTSVAAWQIAMQIFLLLSLTMDTLAIAAQALVATHLGAGSPERARAVSVRLIALGMYLGVAFSAVLLILAFPVAGLFTDSPNVALLGGQLLIWIALLQPLGALAFTLDGILIGASDTRFLAWAMAGVTLVFIIVMFGLSAVGLGIWGVAAGMTVWMALRAVTTLRRFRGPHWAAATLG